MVISHMTRVGDISIFKSSRWSPKRPETTRRLVMITKLEEMTALIKLEVTCIERPSQLIHTMTTSNSIFNIRRYQEGRVMTTICRKWR